MIKPLHTTVTPDAIDRALESLQLSGGFSFHPRTGEFPTEGFALSIYKDREQIIGGPVTRADVLGFVLQNADLLSNPNYLAGAWKDETSGLTYLDVSVIEYDRSTALIRARANNQLAVFDLNTKEEIYL